MKGVLGWVKGHVVVVISAVIALAALPALLFVSNNMNTALRDEVEQDVGSKQRNLQQISVQYNVESLDPSEPLEGFSATPNEATTNAIRSVLEAHDRDATRVLESASARNRAGKEPMLEGLFPAPAPAETTAKRQASARAWLDAHRDLLRRVSAGGPVAEQDMLLLLEAQRTQQVERRLNSLGVTELPEEEQAEVRRALETFRLDRLRERAGDVSFYATLETFEGVEIPESADLPTIEQIWDWQHRYWVHEEIANAAFAANTDPVSGLAYQPRDRPVKRLVTVQTRPWQYAAAVDEEPEDNRRNRRNRNRDSGAAQGGGGASVAPLTSAIRPDFEASLSGRAGWPYKANALYDTRYASVTAIVDSAGIQRFIDALEAENFMTVIDLDLTAIQPIEGMAQGYYYGAGGLMRAEMVVETLWMRDWVGEFAPDSVRERMGLPKRPDPSNTSAEEMTQ